MYFDRAAAMVAPPAAAIAVLQADLARERASPAVRQVAQWAIYSHDHAGLPFVVVDKARARLFAFDPEGRFRGSTPVLLGAVRGDEATVPATPAGRFVADTSLSAHSDGIAWVNADTALWLHGPSERSPGRSAQRLASREIEDKRITDGSLHVAGDFYRDHLSALKQQHSVAYVLPEAEAVPQVFQASRFAQFAEFAQPEGSQPARRPS